VKVEDVEVVRTRAKTVQHREMRGDLGLARRVVEAQRASASGLQHRARPRIPAREKRDLVSEVYQRIGEVRDNAFRPAV